MTLPNRVNYKAGSMRRYRLKKKPSKQAKDLVAENALAKNEFDESHDDDVKDSLRNALRSLFDDVNDSESIPPTYPSAELQTAAQEARHALAQQQDIPQLDMLDPSLLWSFVHTNSIKVAELGSLENLLAQVIDPGRDARTPPNDLTDHAFDDPYGGTDDLAKNRHDLFGSMEKYQQQYEGEALNKFDAILQMMNDQTVSLRYRNAIRTLHQLARVVALRHNETLGSIGGEDLHSSSSSQSLNDAEFQSSNSAGSVPDSPNISDGTLRSNKKRTNLSKTAKRVLQHWFEEHLHHPYPTEEEKDMLGMQGGITIEQVNNWFINTRGRKWKPMLMRLVAQKEAGVECKMLDKVRARLEEPYHRSPM